MRVAAMSLAVGRRLGFDEDHLVALGAAALLHDSAVGAYLQSKRAGNPELVCLQVHCIKGQQYVDSLPLTVPASDYVLFHHEQADGGGLFGKDSGTVPLGAQIISLVDKMDRHFGVSLVGASAPESMLWDAQTYLSDNLAAHFSPQISSSLLAVLDVGMQRALLAPNIERSLEALMPHTKATVDAATLQRITLMEEQVKRAIEDISADQQEDRLPLAA
jgi:response regulator RpfG family c-di-GMP phosphodiesterase